MMRQTYARKRMQAIRSKGTLIERKFGSALRSSGLIFEKQHSIFGKPDFALPSRKIAIFCDSKFWHGYRWGKTKLHLFKKNKSFWATKIERNRKRDKIVNKTLRDMGWKVFRFWDDEIKTNIDGCISRIKSEGKI